MKRCPKCNRTYDDDTLRFCLEDGAALSGASGSRSEPPPTEILYERTAPTLKVSGPTTPTFPRSAEPPAHQSNPLLTVGVITIAILLLVLVCIAAFFVLRQPDANQNAQANSSNESKSTTKKEGQISSEPDSTNDVKTSSQTGNDSPIRITAAASSVRLAVQANTYYAVNAMDGKRSTAWIEGADGAGLGEWIRFDFDREVKVRRILILPGYFKSPEIWRDNNRLALATAYFSDGSSRDLTFLDRMESQKFDVGSVKTKFVRIVIKQIYAGTDPDTAVSEVAFEWEP